MKFKTKVLDIQSLQALACSSEDGEAFQILSRNSCYRIGAGVRIDQHDTYSYFIEVALVFGRRFSKINVQSLGKLVNFIGALEERGFTTSIQDTGLFVCECIVKFDEMESKCLEILEVVKSSSLC